jgi:hypothetical protein
VDTTAKTVTITARTKEDPKKQVAVTTDASTKISIDGVADKKLEDIQPKMTVKVTPATGIAMTIEATAPVKKDKKNK